MSMTRKEAALILQSIFDKSCGNYRFQNAKKLDKEDVLWVAIKALNTPTREQVERMRGEWVHTHSTDNFWTEVWKCSYCGFEDDNGDCFDFCPECGQPKTDEAVDMMLERWKGALE